MKCNEDILLEYINTLNKPFTIDDVFKKTGIAPKRALQDSIYNIIDYSGQFVLDNEFIYPKAHFLKDIPIRILPTEFELEHNILIPGHRILPFDPPRNKIDPIVIKYKGKKQDVSFQVLMMIALEICRSFIEGKTEEAESEKTGKKKISKKTMSPWDMFWVDSLEQQGKQEKK